MRESNETHQKEEPTPEQRLEAVRWMFVHRQGFLDALSRCYDVQTLRALAHRLGYKEGT